MKPQLPSFFAWLIYLVIFPRILCDEQTDASKFNKLACICSPPNQSFSLGSNCTTSCNCSPESGTKRWTCLCGTDIDPVVTAGNLRASCFTSCNCTAGSSSQADSSKIWIFSKSVVIILLIFGLVMTLAFITFVARYTYQRNKYPAQGLLFSSDKDSSINSGTKFISYRASSIPEYKVYIDGPVKPIAGCIYRTSFLFRRKSQRIIGTLERFSYSELEDATEKFSSTNLIGVGSSSQVYRGNLRCGQTVAVKRLKIWGGPDFEAIFLAEIELLSRLHHFHLVPLLGYCSENQGKHVERLLVFKYMSNGNLRECLDGASGKFLDWSSRVAIALGAAKGLEYLHEAAAPKILHRDVKSTNVLLDEKLRAKITDLGMAKHLKTDDLPSCSSSPDRLQGTFGYFAPEYAIIGRASLKSDVFSFGVVLLELITGRQPINRNTKGEESLVIWATPRLLDSKRVIAELPDPQLNGDFPGEEMQIMSYLAKECLLLDPDSRPSMSEAVQILSTIASEKSRRQNISRTISLFQNSFHSIKSDEDESADKHAESEELKEVISGEALSDRCSLPLHIDRSLCADIKGKRVDTYPEDVDRMLLPAAKASTLPSHEDEAVDISEPRFESFCVEYVRSSV